MDELATKLVDSLTKVEDALETMAPTAFKALVEAAYITGVTAIIQGFLLLLLCAAGFTVMHVGLKQEEDSIGIPMTIGGGVLALFSLVVALIILFGFDPWLKIINPTAYVVKTLLAQ